MNKILIPILKAQNSAYGPLDYSFLTTLIGQKRIRHILDIGTGEGSFILGLAQKTPHVKYRAIDASQELIDYAQRNKTRAKNQNVQFDCQHFDDKFPFGNFDMIIARFSMEHAKNVDSFIKSVFHKLRHGGTFAIIEYYVDDGNIQDSVWLEFKKRELAMYKKIKSHPRLGLILPALLSRHRFKNIESSFLQISPATVGARPFYHLVKTSGQLYGQIDPVNWPKVYLNRLTKWCNKISKRKSVDPMFFLTHTIGQKPWGDIRI